MSWLVNRSRLQFSLRSLLVVLALASAYFGGRTAQRRDVRELEIERNELRERIAKHDRAAQTALFLRNFDGVSCYAPRVSPVALGVKNGEVELSFGPDDGFKQGSLVDLRRDEVVIATVKVIRVTTDRSFAIPCRASDLGRVRRGDHAIVR